MPRSSWTVLGHFGDTNSGSINSHHILGGEVELTERNWPLPRSAGNGSGILPRPCGWRWIVLENKITLDEKSIHRAKGCSGQLSIQYIYSMNPTDRYFWTSTLQNKAFSNQNKGHLVFRYIIHVYNYNSLHAESQVPVVGFPFISVALPYGRVQSAGRQASRGVAERGVWSVEVLDVPGS